VANNPSDKPSKHQTKVRDRVLAVTGTTALPDAFVQAIDAQLRTGRRRVPDSETSRLYCSAEWHFSRFEGGTYCFPIYSLAMRMAFASEMFWPSLEELAEYLNADIKAIREAVHLLVLSGFFVVVKAELGETVRYRPVPHDEWEKTNPGLCVHKDEMPWSGGDELGRQLYAVTGGWKLFPSYLVAFRKTGHSDSAIVAHCKAWVKTYTGQRWRGAAKDFVAYLKAIAVTPTEIRQGSGTEIR
jgi:hypothetical protein